MASGHVNRTNRPNTWLHRPACKREEKPCQLGAVHSCGSMSAFGGKADIECSDRVFPLLTQSSHRPDRNPAVQQSTAVALSRQPAAPPTRFRTFQVIAADLISCSLLKAAAACDRN